MTIDIPILQILERVEIRGNTAFLPTGQLDRKVYEKVNKCLEAIGGKWNRKSKGHVFDSDPTDLLDSVVVTGQVTDWRKELQFFPTPRPVALQMLDLAELSGSETILEPSAGKGAILDVVRERFPRCHLFANDINPKFRDVLLAKRYTNVSCDDFLRFTFATKFVDRIIMNPPFTRQQDVDHIAHAFENFLKPGGILVSVVSESPFFRSTAKSEMFRRLVTMHGTSFSLPAGAFAESGTEVMTRIVKLVADPRNN
jgi:hypothetical protein